MKVGILMGRFSSSSEHRALLYSRKAVAMQVPAYDPLFFGKIVTRDASPEAGAAEQCVPNIRQAWRVLFDWGSRKDRLEDLKSSMRLCPEARLKGRSDVDALAYWLQSAFDFLAMVPHSISCLILHCC